MDIKGEDIGGIAVNIAARIAALADSGQVMVSRTVRDLVAGSNIRFEDRGAHALKGLDESMVLEVVAADSELEHRTNADVEPVGPSIAVTEYHDDEGTQSRRQGVVG